MIRRKPATDTEVNTSNERMFDLLDLETGQVLEFRSNSSKYWVTRTTLGKLAHQDQVNWSDEVIGFALQTTSEVMSKFTGVAPNELVLSRYVRLNKSYSLGFRGATGYIVEFSVLR